MIHSLLVSRSPEFTRGDSTEVTGGGYHYPPPVTSVESPRVNSGDISHTATGMWCYPKIKYKTSKMDSF